MFAWLRRLLDRNEPPELHEPEVHASRLEQRRRFDAWELTKAEVRRVERIAARQHAVMHRPRRGIR